MFLRVAFPLVAVVAFFLCLGCAWTRKPKQPAPLPVPTPPPAPAIVEVGKVMLVDTAGHFVLVDHGDLAPPPTGGALKSFTNGTESAELVATPVRRGAFTVADIHSGDPRKGDRVFYVPPALHKTGAGAPMKLPESTLAPASPLPPANQPSSGPALDQ